MQYGTHLLGLTQRLPEPATLQPNKTYQINIEAEGITDAEATADYVLDKLNKEYPEMRVNWISVCEATQTINVQFSIASPKTLGSQPRTLMASSVITWLPTVLILIGVIVTLISILELYRTIPWHVWGGLAVGIILIFWGPTISKMLTAPIPKKTA